jgi:hypothetical protein
MGVAVANYKAYATTVLRYDKTTVKAASTGLLACINHTGVFP